MTKLSEEKHFAKGDLLWERDYPLFKDAIHEALVMGEDFEMIRPERMVVYAAVTTKVRRYVGPLNRTCLVLSSRDLLKEKEWNFIVEVISKKVAEMLTDSKFKWETFESYSRIIEKTRRFVN